ncbi:MAG TPA: AI-2E family transporter [Polyangiaceae bacterium]|nr:AI-2E family transporter [Polyangiaceae bacterium]
MDSRESQDFFLSRVTAGTIRVVLLGGWIAWCLQIILPFLVPILWGAIIATAVYPLSRRLSLRRPALGALSFGAVALAVIVVPAYLFFDSVGSFVVRVGRQWAQGELKLPPPRAEVANWPLVGERIYGTWMMAVNAPASVVEAHLPQLREVGRWLAQSLGGLSIGILQSLFAVALAVAFLMKAEASQRALLPVAERVAPGRGEHLVELASATVRAVAKGVLGVAAIQAVLAWVGMAVAGIPAPGAWALLVLICAVAQLPTIIVLGPMIVYVFASSSVNVAIPFTIWSLFIGVIDNVLKPILLGRGAGVPTLVIVIGAIGGMISSGIIGLFVGAVVLAVGYELFAAWVKGSEGETDALASAAARLTGTPPPPPPDVVRVPPGA